MANVGYARVSTRASLPGIIIPDAARGKPPPSRASALPRHPGPNATPAASPGAARPLSRCI
jgi:hypothetical protein